jgi:microcystin-dependent protein
LFNVIGGLYGNGNNVTTFNLPNFNGKMPIGANATYTTGLSGGSADAIVISHTHSVSGSVTTSGQSASHSHSITVTSGGDHSHGITDSGHTHNSRYDTRTPGSIDFNDGAGFEIGGAGTSRGWATTSNSTGISINSGGSHSHSASSGNASVDHTHTASFSATSGSTGSSGTGANLPPYLGINFIIKY